jgi:predicted MPP superfamily phosphohydrolase
MPQPGVATPDVAPPKYPVRSVFFLARAVLVVGLVLCALTFLHGYLGVQLITNGGVPVELADLAWGLLWVAYGSIFVGTIGGRLLPRPWGKRAQWVGFGWMGAFFVLLCALAFTDLLLWFASWAAEVGPQWHRWRAAGVVLGSAVALALGLRTARRPVVKRVEVRFPGLHPSFDGFRVVQLSDVHIGETLDGAFLERVVATVNALKPDMVAVTGDLVDGPVKRLRDEVAPLGKLEARFGTYFVSGNHEYYSGAGPWEAELERLGLTVLHNQHRLVQQGEAKLVVAGVTDLQGGQFSALDRPDLDAALEGSPAGVPRLLLAHQPRFAKSAGGRGIALMLSGHTHGGQIFPFSLLVKLQQPVVGGLHTIAGVLTYTSLGTGYWGPPFRIGTRGEISEIILRS